MTPEKMAHNVGKGVGRRKVLQRAGAVAVAGTFSMLGLSQKANADPVRVACCSLCSKFTNCSGVRCSWSWICCQNGTSYRCIEGYRSGSAGTDSCKGCLSSLTCSKAVVIGRC